MPRYTFHLSLEAAEVEAYYRGYKQWIQVYCDEGQTIRLPWSKFRSFFRHDGLKGRFVLTLGPHHQFIKLEQQP